MGERSGDGGQEFFVGSGSERSKGLFDLAPHFFNRVEVWRVGRQEPNSGSGLFDQGRGLLVLVRGEVGGGTERSEIACPKDGPNGEAKPRQSERLKRIIADLSVQNHILKEANAKNGEPVCKKAGSRGQRGRGIREQGGRVPGLGLGPIGSLSARLGERGEPVHPQGGAGVERAAPEVWLPADHGVAAPERVRGQPEAGGPDPAGRRLEGEQEVAAHETAGDRPMQMTTGSSAGFFGRRPTEAAPRRHGDLPGSLIHQISPKNLKNPLTPADKVPRLLAD